MNTSQSDGNNQKKQSMYPNHYVVAVSAKFCYCVSEVSRRFSKIMNSTILESPEKVLLFVKLLTSIQHRFN
jgi:hypothetical protein